MLRLHHLVSIALVAVLSFACSCGGSGGGDPKAATDAAYATLGKSDWKAAKAEFDAVLATLPTTDPNYKRAKMGQIEALIHLDAPKARDEFLAMASGMSSQVDPKDYKSIGGKLTSEKKFIEAIAVVDAGLKAHTEDPSLQAVMASIVAESKKANDPAALSALKGLGYLGD